MSPLDTELVREYCPYCGEVIQLIIDTSVEEQQYIEDCEVCCRPFNVDAQVDIHGDLSCSVELKRTD